LLLVVNESKSDARRGGSQSKLESLGFYEKSQNNRGKYPSAIGCWSNAEESFYVTIVRLSIRRSIRCYATDDFSAFVSVENNKKRFCVVVVYVSISRDETV